MKHEEQLSSENAVVALTVADQLLESMVQHQRTKVLAQAREAVPHISSEDVLNPNDYPALKAHPSFDYEDGILAGLVSAQIALRSEFRRRILTDPRPEGS